MQCVRSVPLSLHVTVTVGRCWRRCRWRFCDAVVAVAVVIGGCPGCTMCSFACWCFVLASGLNLFLHVPRFVMSTRRHKQGNNVRDACCWDKPFAGCIKVVGDDEIYRKKMPSVHWKSVLNGNRESDAKRAEFIYRAFSPVLRVFVKIYLSSVKIGIVCSFLCTENVEIFGIW